MSSDIEGRSHRSGCRAAPSALQRTRSRLGWTGRAGILALAMAACPALARSATASATPTATPAEGCTTTVITGGVFEAGPPPAVAIAGAAVEFTIAGRPPAVAARTDADGGFAVTLCLYDEDQVDVSVSAEGYLKSEASYTGEELRYDTPIYFSLQPAPARVDTEVSGLVYDAAIGTGAPITGAEVEYVYHNYEDAFPDLSGTVRTGPDGRYQFDVPLGPNDYVEFGVAAPGFAIWSSYANASQLLTGSPVDFGLAAIGGVVEIEPGDMTVTCSGSFDITVTNVGPPGEVLLVLGITFVFDYGEGVYGQDFTWDLSAIQFPVLLARGERLTFPVTFHGGGEFPSRLFVTVVSGAQEGSGEVVYFGDIQGCHGCRGDCDGDGVVTISELVRGVGIALGNRVEPCFALAMDYQVTIDELVAAVASALEGCPPPPE